MSVASRKFAFPRRFAAKRLYEVAVSPSPRAFGPAAEVRPGSWVRVVAWWADASAHGLYRQGQTTRSAFDVGDRPAWLPDLKVSPRRRAVGV